MVSESTFEVYSIQLMDSRVAIIFSEVDVCIWSNEHTLTPLIYIDCIIFIGSEWSQCPDSSDVGIHIIDS